MSGETLRVVGRRVRKVDGVELVTGRAKFTGDLRFPGMVYGYAARASVPAARIKRIDVSAAEMSDGVLLVLRGSDIPGPNIIGILPPFDQPLLATEVIRYAGESLALVVAESQEAARRAARLVKADLEPLAPVLTIDEALAEGARAIHPKGNVTCANRLVKGDVEKGFSKADVVVEGTYETSHQEHGYLEPEAACAVPSADGRMTVYASCQSPFHLRGHIAANLGVPASSVRVVQSYTGGSSAKTTWPPRSGVSPRSRRVGWTGP
jgi:CO/xanthine dehydrogenase Mo-binding subunit